ncbi:MAG: KilA-N domain-containing protein, partial [Anaerolineae bacterium]|nr:KilA-N domain-containing protein [Anaerolineae bacterium]
MAKKKNQIITVEGQEITIKQVDNEDYISLTDMAGRGEKGSEIIRNWMRTRSTVLFLMEWEVMYNPDFNLVESHQIRDEASSGESITFVLSVKEWIERTNAKGIVSKPGRYGGTFAHKDIAFEFGLRISPRFKLHLIREFQRLKEEEYSRQQLEWNYQRFLTKVNYRLHTDTIKDHIIPMIQKQRENALDWVIYAEEADLLNMAVFGMTARQWREQNPEDAKKGNMRDFAEIAQLHVLANLEGTNAILIEHGMTKEERFEILAQAAISQYKRLVKDE